MTTPSTRPRRSVRSELLFLAALFSMPAALSALFPYSAVAFASRPEARRSDPSCAFVELSEEVETKAMDRVRAALSVRRDRVGGLKADLSLSTLPEEPARAIVSESDMGVLAGPVAPGGDFVPYPPSMASAEPDKIEAAPPEAAAPAFPKEDLLRIRIE